MLSSIQINFPSDWNACYYIARPPESSVHSWWWVVSSYCVAPYSHGSIRYMNSATYVFIQQNLKQHGKFFWPSSFSFSFMAKYTPFQVITSYCSYKKGWCQLILTIALKSISTTCLNTKLYNKTFAVLSENLVAKLIQVTKQRIKFIYYSAGKKFILQLTFVAVGELIDKLLKGW